MADEFAAPAKLLRRLSVGFSWEIWKCEVGLPSGHRLVRAIRISHTSCETKLARQQLTQLRVITGLDVVAGMPKYLGIGEFWGRLCVLTELAQFDLSYFVRDENSLDRTGLRTLLGLIHDVASTLDGLHERALVHGAITPQHVLVCNGHAVLTGFSLLHPLGGPIPHLGAMDLMTWSCMSPEMHNRAADLSSDQFSLAATYLAMRCGGPATIDPTWLPAGVGSLQGDEARVVSRALAQSSNARFPTCVAFSDELRSSVRQ